RASDHSDVASARREPARYRVRVAGGFSDARLRNTERSVATGTPASGQGDRGIMVFTVAFAAVALPDAVMLSACLVLTLAVLTFVFWIEPDEADSAPHRSQLDQLLE